MMPNQVTGANAGRARRFQIRALRAARIAQFFRSASYEFLDQMTTSGDNLIVELDISAGNLPVGTRLRIGEAIVEVTAKPHNGCQKFARRFGEDALRFVQTPATRHHNLRGIYWRVVFAGEAGVGAQIQVLSRPAAG